MNAREHWRKRSRRVKAERTAVAWALMGKAPPKPPCTVKMTRLAPSNGLDSDNLRCSLGTTLASLAIVKACGWRWPASFVEWMMGWPIQWSVLKPLETGKFRQWLQQHGECLEAPEC